MSNKKARVISNGTRRSCNKLKRIKVDKQIITEDTTAMRNAFSNAVCGHCIGLKKTVLDLMNGRSKFSGVTKYNRGWSVDLSRRTYDRLKSQGIIA